MIRSEDLRRLFSGCSAVVVAGLVAGAYMHPQLVDLSIAGPQLQTGASGVRSVREYDQVATWAAYGAKVPDYVIGTDWLRPPAPPPAQDDGLDARIDAIDRDTAPVMAYATSDYATDAIEPSADPETAQPVDEDPAAD